MSRSASVLPTSGLPWLSACTSSILYPLRSPFLFLAQGMLTLGCSPLIISTAVTTAAWQRCPALATGPVSGKRVPILITLSAAVTFPAPGPNMKHNTASAKTQLNKRKEWRVMGLPPLLVANELYENGMDVNLKHV